MGRSKWKKDYIPHYLNNKVLNNKKKSIWIWCRNAVIQSEYIGERFLVHNGKRNIPVTINENMVGHKFGEFAYTRTKYIPKNKKK